MFANPCDEICRDAALEPLLAFRISFRYLAENEIGETSPSHLHSTCVD